MATGSTIPFLKENRAEKGNIPAAAQAYRFPTTNGVEYDVTLTGVGKFDPVLTVDKQKPLDDSSGGGKETHSFTGDGKEVQLKVTGFKQSSGSYEILVSAKALLLKENAPDKGNIPAGGAQTYRFQTTNGVDYEVTLTGVGKFDPVLTVDKQKPLDVSGGGEKETYSFTGDGKEMQLKVTGYKQSSGSYTILVNSKVPFLTENAPEKGNIPQASGTQAYLFKTNAGVDYVVTATGDGTFDPTLKVDKRQPLDKSGPGGEETHSFKGTGTDLRLEVAGYQKSYGSYTIRVGTQAPSKAISPPSVMNTTSGPVEYTVTYTNATSINLRTSDVTLNKTGTADGTVTVSKGAMTVPTGTTATLKVVISGVTGDGTLWISIAPGRASGAAGTTDVGTAHSTTFNVDNTSPIATIGAPSVTNTTAGPVIYPVTYAGALSFNLLQGNVSLNRKGTANGTVTVSDGNTNPKVEIKGITGDGTLGISLDPGIARDSVGNTDAGAGPSATVNVGNALFDYYHIIHGSFMIGPAGSESRGNFQAGPDYRVFNEVLTGPTTVSVFYEGDGRYHQGKCYFAELKSKGFHENRCYTFVEIGSNHHHLYIGRPDPFTNVYSGYFLYFCSNPRNHRPSLDVELQVPRSRRYNQFNPSFSV